MTRTLLASLLTATALYFSAAAHAGTHIEPTSASAGAPVAADVILVDMFAGSPDQVRLDPGVGAQLKSHLLGEGRATQQSADASAAQQRVADEVVRRLQALGLNARRGDAVGSIDAAAGSSAIVVDGRFDTIDAGQRRRRMLIGFGAGKSEVSASVTLAYRPAGGPAETVASFTASADSGAMPGIAETAGVGAAAGHLATAAATGGGLHAAGEARHDTLSADESKLADAIAKQIAKTVGASTTQTASVQGAIAN